MLRVLQTYFGKIIFADDNQKKLNCPVCLETSKTMFFNGYLLVELSRVQRHDASNRLRRPEHEYRLSPASSQPELFPRTVMAHHGGLLPATSRLIPMPNGSFPVLSACWINICANQAYLFPQTI